MTISISPLADGDFFPWFGLFEEYGRHYGSPVTDRVALQAWAWMTDPAHELSGLIARDEDGAPVGLAHHRRFVRPLTATAGVCLEDLFVLPSAREQGTGAALVEAVREAARAQGARILQLQARPDDESAQRLYGSIADPSAWTTYEAAL